MRRLLAIVMVLCAAPVFACDQPFSVFQNGPNTILTLRVKQGPMGQKLTAEETKLLAAYDQDEQEFVSRQIKTDPVCSDVPDPHNCVSECKNREAAEVKAATYHEGTMRYSTSPEERKALLKEQAALEQKWAGK